MTKIRLLTLFSVIFSLTVLVSSKARVQKLPLTLDEFFNSVEIRSVKLSPNGGGAVIATERADWEHNRWRGDGELKSNPTRRKVPPRNSEN